MCRKLIQRDQSQSIVLDADMLSALAAGLSRRVCIDGLYRLMKDIRGEFSNADILVCFLNILLNALNLCSPDSFIAMRMPLSKLA